MEIKAELINPTSEERIHFIVEQNHNNGYEIKEYDTTETREETIINPETGEEETIEVEVVTHHLEAWGYTEEEIEEQEKEAIAKLSLTGADVERAIYKAKGMDFDDIIAYIEQSEVVGLDIKALKIELKANNFYRGNPYVSAVGKILGFTEEELDYLFVHKELPEVEDESI